MKVINIYGPPFSGKSTLAAFLFSEIHKYKECFVCHEWTKPLFYSKKTIDDFEQFTIFSDMYRQAHYVKDKVEVLISDCPSLLIAFYSYLRKTWYSQTVENLAIEFNQWISVDSYNIFLKIPESHTNSNSAEIGRENWRDIQTKMLRYINNHLHLDLITDIDSRTHILEEVTNYIRRQR